MNEHHENHDDNADYNQKECSRMNQEQMCMKMKMKMKMNQNGVSNEYFVEKKKWM